MKNTEVLTGNKFNGRRLWRGKSQLLFPASVLGVAALSICLPIRINSAIMVASAVFSLTYAVLKHQQIKGSSTAVPFLLLIFLNFGVALLGWVVSPGSSGKGDLQRSAYTVISIIIFSFNWKFDIPVKSLINWFCGGVVVTCTFGFLTLLFFSSNSQGQQVIFHGHTHFTDLISIHPTYLSIYLIFIFFFLTEELRTGFRSMKGWEMGLYVFGVLLVVAMLLFVRSQMELLVFAVSCVIYLIILQKRRAWFTAFLLCIAALMVFLLDKDRVQTVFDRYGKNVSTALDNRFQVWAGAWEAIKSAPILGAGTGGQQLALKEGYKKVGYQEGIDKSYNAHNQYLESWVRNGIVELALLLALLIYSFRQSLKSPNHVFLMFLIVFSLSMFTESCLSVHRGVVFFYFFLSAFIYLPYSKNSAELKANAL